VRRRRRRGSSGSRAECAAPVRERGGAVRRPTISPRGRPERPCGRARGVRVPPGSSGGVGPLRTCRESGRRIVPIGHAGSRPDVRRARRRSRPGTTRRRPTTNCCAVSTPPTKCRVRRHVGDCRREPVNVIQGPTTGPGGLRRRHGAGRCAASHLSHQRACLRARDAGPARRVPPPREGWTGVDGRPREPPPSRVIDPMTSVAGRSAGDRASPAPIVRTKVRPGSRRSAPQPRPRWWRTHPGSRHDHGARHEGGGLHGARRPVDRERRVGRTVRLGLRSGLQGKLNACNLRPMT